MTSRCTFQRVFNFDPMGATAHPGSTKIPGAQPPRSLRPSPTPPWTKCAEQGASLGIVREEKVMEKRFKKKGGWCEIPVLWVLSSQIPVANCSSNPTKTCALLPRLRRPCSVPVWCLPSRSTAMRMLRPADARRSRIIHSSHSQLLSIAVQSLPAFCDHCHCFLRGFCQSFVHSWYMCFFALSLPSNASNTCRMDELRWSSS